MPAVTHCFTSAAPSSTADIRTTGKLAAAAEVGGRAWRRPANLPACVTLRCHAALAGLPASGQAAAAGSAPMSHRHDRADPPVPAKGRTSLAGFQARSWLVGLWALDDPEVWSLPARVRQGSGQRRLAERRWRSWHGSVGGRKLDQDSGVGRKRSLPALGARSAMPSDQAASCAKLESSSSPVSGSATFSSASSPSAIGPTQLLPARHRSRVVAAASSSGSSRNRAAG